MQAVTELTAYIGLGSNLQQPEQQIKTAIAALQALDGCRVMADSGYYGSRPMGPADQPDYVNAVVALQTTLSASALLAACQAIEAQQGRVRKRRWGERCIDLDILLYGDEQYHLPELQIPHPGICQRDFVYMPLLKLAPEIQLPGAGRLRDCIDHDAAQSGYGCHYLGAIL